MKKAKLIIDMPNGCEDCPLHSIFFDSDWNIQRGVRHMSCRLNLDRATEVGKGIPAYCPLEEINESNTNR